jgi:hypothetical protein
MGNKLNVIKLRLGRESRWNKNVEKSGGEKKRKGSQRKKQDNMNRKHVRNK